MKSKIMPTISVVFFIMFAALLIYSTIAYPMYFGEPSYYHIARVDYLTAAAVCGLTAIASVFASEFF